MCTNKADDSMHNIKDDQVASVNIHIRLPSGGKCEHCDLNCGIMVFLHAEFRVSGLHRNTKIKK